MGIYGIETLGVIKVLDYFADSNFAGKVVIFVLVFLNCTAIALMWSKFQQIKRAIRNNARDEKRINSLPSIADYDDSLYPGEGSPYLTICSRAMDAAHRGKQQGKVRMNYVENAIRRALAEVGDGYEAKMYWLATIVSGAPFLGLLGTVWGVMDAFGTMDSGGATIEHLAPGVSGALLTTVAALCVAIPIVFVYNGLLGMTRGAMTKLENFASNLADRIELEMDS
ncbi:MotA/TolQ/ExbB proton channel family protein [Opitutales bacterium]|jgi:biopolymer transport protein TolQ|nr:MotA/TolQ/ExbB proton channel family protein [Opitutales bacterium]MDA8991520.1 MotA/TolQ/ExbB proton channel family protein [Opitutales bacterium]